MKLFYDVITGFLYNEIVLYPIELKGDRTGIKAAKFSTKPCCDTQAKDIYVVCLEYDIFDDAPCNMAENKQD